MYDLHTGTFCEINIWIQRFSFLSYGKVVIIGFVIAGDPRQDIEHEHYISQRTPLIMPEPIRKFLLYFQRCIGEMKVMEIQDAYENG
jgi:hypothetical protein